MVTTSDNRLIEIKADPLLADRLFYFWQAAVFLLQLNKIGQRTIGPLRKMQPRGGHRQTAIQAKKNRSTMAADLAFSETLKVKAE
ncbi:hypothetical protein [Buttiauxella brennerae]|uniref:hypothetical protein n=1 Tax=Buttiauxella brennerae TaxID=82988 RepID=UPI0007E48AC4|nr:hypothetical protein [Buttiauxella brennerae]